MRAEATIGADLSRVRVHADPAADASATHLDADAFTVGRLSDYDVAIVSDALVSRARGLGIPFTAEAPREGVLTLKQLQSLGLTDLHANAQNAALLATGVPHEVNFKLCSTAGAMGLRLPVPE